MTCPLCGHHLLGGGPVIYRVWQEMESDEQTIVGVHLSCAWQAIRDSLYEREEGGPIVGYAWIGWEPMTPSGEST